MNKPLVTLFSCICYVFVTSQDYLDIARLNLSRTNLNDAEDTFETDITNINFEVLYPIVLNEKWVLLSGMTVENTNIVPNASSEAENLTMTRMNAGFKIKHSEKWSGTYVILPKLASNFESVGSQDFQIGGLFLFDFEYTKNIRAKFGLYSSSENFGTIVTPMIGAFYRSLNKKFHVDAALPIRMEANYVLGNHFSIGVDLRTSIKSYNLGGSNTNLYVQEESVRAGIYGSYGLLNDAILLRAKVGYDTTDYGLYALGDKVGVQVLTFTLNEDNRIRLNNEFDGNLFFGLDLVYRYDITSK